MIMHSQAIVTTSWDDGHPMDLKLAEFLLEFGIKGTLYVAPYNRERAVMMGSDLRALSEYFEIGAHTLTHPDLRRLNNQQLENEISGSKLRLEDLLGKPVNMFCYPKGRHSQRVRQAVQKAGFMGARTIKEFYLNLENDAWRIPTTLQAFPLPPWIRLRHEIKIRNWHGLGKFWKTGINKTWVQLAMIFLEELLNNGGIWHLWGHSWEVEKYGLWEGLKAVFDMVAHHEDIRYLTNAQILKEWTGSSSK